MTNAWAMLFDHLNGGDDRPVTDDATGTFEFPIEFGSSEEMIHAAAFVPVPGAYGEDTICLGETNIPQEAEPIQYNPGVVITDDAKPLSGKDATFWKYDEGKILREVEAYLSGTYKGHYAVSYTHLRAHET